MSAPPPVIGLSRAIKTSAPAAVAVNLPAARTSLSGNRFQPCKSPSYLDSTSLTYPQMLACLPRHINQALPNPMLSTAETSMSTSTVRTLPKRYLRGRRRSPQWTDPALPSVALPLATIMFSLSPPCSSHRSGDTTCIYTTTSSSATLCCTARGMWPCLTFPCRLRSGGTSCRGKW
jgi:hypothetical protein